MDPFAMPRGFCIGTPEILRWRATILMSVQSANNCNIIWSVFNGGSSHGFLLGHEHYCFEAEDMERWRTV